MVVADVLAGVVPANATGSGRVLGGVEQRLLPLVIRTVWFDQIYYIEFVLDVLANVADLEVEPLGVVRRANVILEDQVVSVFAYAQGAPQISRLETTLESQRCVTF